MLPISDGCGKAADGGGGQHAAAAVFAAAGRCRRQAVGSGAGRHHRSRELATNKAGTIVKLHCKNIRLSQKFWIAKYHLALCHLSSRSNNSIFILGIDAELIFRSIVICHNFARPKAGAGQRLQFEILCLKKSTPER